MGVPTLHTLSGAPGSRVLCPSVCSGNKGSVEWSSKEADVLQSWPCCWKLSCVCCLGPTSECRARRIFSFRSWCGFSASTPGKTFLRYCSGSKIGVGIGIGGEKIKEGLSFTTGSHDVCFCSTETYNFIFAFVHHVYV